MGKKSGRYMNLRELRFQAFRKALRNNPVEAVRMVASDNLGIIEEERCVEPLLECMKTATQANVRDFCAIHLARFDDGRIPEALKAVEKSDGARLALAWLLCKHEGAVPIPGTTKIERLEENAAAADIVLTPDEMAAIDAIAPRGVAAGERYSEMGMAAVDL